MLTHLYQPNAADAKAVAKADIIFVNGMGFETWSETLISNAGGGNATVVVATKGIAPLRVEGEIDPHAWNALTNGVIYVENIAAAMAEMTRRMQVPTGRMQPLTSLSLWLFMPMLATGLHLCQRIAVRS